ncbi:unnamed protein product, partial [Prorocentrum cordatum]
DLSAVPAATRVELDDVGKDIQGLKDSLMRIARSAKLSASGSPVASTRSGSEGAAGDVEDVFHTLAPDTVKAAEERLAGIDRAVTEVNQAYAELATWYGEKRGNKSGDLATHEWLGYIDIFLQDLQRSEAARKVHMEKVQRQARRKKQAVRKAASQPAPRPAEDAAAEGGRRPEEAALGVVPPLERLAEGGPAQPEGSPPLSSPSSSHGNTRRRRAGREAPFQSRRSNAVIDHFGGAPGGRSPAAQGTAERRCFSDPARSPSSAQAAAAAAPSPAAATRSPSADAGGGGRDRAARRPGGDRGRRDSVGSSVRNGSSERTASSTEILASAAQGLQALAARSARSGTPSSAGRTVSPGSGTGSPTRPGLPHANRAPSEASAARHGRPL